MPYVTHRTVLLRKPKNGNARVRRVTGIPESAREVRRVQRRFELGYDYDSDEYSELEAFERDGKSSRISRNVSYVSRRVDWE
jgi:hypothetical protein